jgi:hypothetical protein
VSWGIFIYAIVTGNDINEQQAIGNRQKRFKFDGKYCKNSIGFLNMEPIQVGMRHHLLRFSLLQNTPSFAPVHRAGFGLQSPLQS